MSVQLFMKRLVDVEIDPSRSNQHEFNAGRLKKALGFKDTTRGTIDFLFYLDDDSPPETVEDEYTLYDSRKDQPHRSAEWRMYYREKAVSTYARRDDLLLVFRPEPRGTDLLAVVIRPGTAIERELVRSLAEREPDELLTYLSIDAEELDREAAETVLAPLDAAPPEAETRDVRQHPLFLEAVEQGKVPPTKRMAEAAQDIIRVDGVTAADPDDFLYHALEAESGLFFAIESTLGNSALAELREEAGALDFESVMEFAQSYAQSRRSRRGESLQNHFQELLEQREIPHSAQCTTEPGKVPDFIFPSCQSYHDEAFPAVTLRMVGCKTKVRERHKQWITEARRIRLKYGLCHDRGLTDTLIQQYEGELRFFLARELLETTYADRACRPLLGSVGQLVADLEAAAGGNS